jgi:outer membrane protein OmpA-like peptidoglycan-associated protein
MINRILARRQNDADDHWISLSDIMTSLMMLFLLISVIYMLQVQESVDLPKIFKEDQTALHGQMQRTFDGKMTQWGAVLSPDLTVRFNNADIQFAVGSSELRPQFQQALNDFFPQVRQDFARSAIRGTHQRNPHRRPYLDLLGKWRNTRCGVSEQHATVATTRPSDLDLFAHPSAAV